MTEKHNCECEHASHFEPTEGEERALSPNGNPHHYYGKEFFDRFLVVVKTDYGTFRVCKDCAYDCHGNSDPTQRGK